MITKYKNKHKDQECIIFGTGPSLKHLDRDICNNKTLLGSNEIIYHDIPMDYYMIGDGGTTTRGYYSDPEAYHNYKPNIAKLCRQPPTNRRSGYRPLPIGLDAFIYFKADREAWRDREPFDVDKINDAGSISLDLAQLSLILGFKKIYLVGQDCDYNSGSFVSKAETSTIKWSKIMVPMWIAFKKFVDKNFKHVEIININPVGLKGLFREL